MTVRIVLLTDFGTQDGYVAAMKGVLASRAPRAVVVDASHTVSRGDVESAALTLERYWRLFPEGTVHCVVVDPGVGTDRKAVAVHADGRFLVAPDNGVLSRSLTGAERWTAIELSRKADHRPPLSTTFHGRDVFAPAAAALARGDPLGSLGTPLDDLVLIDRPDPVRREGEIHGSVIGVDRFGNLVTNVPGGWIDGHERVEVGGRAVELMTSYGFAPPGGLLAVVNSDGRLEIAVRDGSAAEALAIGAGAPVRVFGQSPSSHRRSASER